MGLVSPALRQDIARRSQEVLAAIDAGHWREAHDKREVGRGWVGVCRWHEGTCAAFKQPDCLSGAGR